MADISDYEGLFRPAEPVAAPHGGRLVAFGVDLIIILLVGLVAGGGWLRILGVFVAYHTALVWLTGQTIGKAVANLEVQRVDGHAYQRRTKGLPWALGRASIGYLLVDMLGLGVLIALPRRNVARRCLHDLVFGSRVVLRGEPDWAIPKMRKRLSDFATRREDASRRVEEAHEGKRRMSNLWQWMVTGALGLEKVLDFIQHAVTQVSTWFGGAGQAHAGAATLSTKTAAGVAVGSGAVTVGAVATLAMAMGPSAELAELSVVDTWKLGDTNYVVRVEETGPTSYRGRSLNAYEVSSSGCIYPAGEIHWEFTGKVDYFGRVWWSGQRDGECYFYWSPGIFGLYDHGTDDPADDTLKVCSTSARADEEICNEYSRR